MARCRISILLSAACLWAGLLLFACSPSEETPAPVQRVVKGKIPAAGPQTAPAPKPAPAPTAAPTAPAAPPVPPVASIQPPSPVAPPEAPARAVTAQAPTVPAETRAQPATPNAPTPVQPQAEPTPAQPREAPAAQVEASDRQPPRGETATPTDTAGTKDAVATIDLKTLLSFEKPYRYDPEGKIDPFVTVFETQEPTEMETEEGKPTKRIPQSPLEMVDLSQLKLTAVILASSGNRALVQDATGKGYIVHIGTYLGNREGQVAKIFQDRLIVAEKGQDTLGRPATVEREIKLPKPPGEM